MEAGSEELYHLFQGTFNRTAGTAEQQLLDGYPGQQQQQQPQQQPQQQAWGFPGAELDFYGQQQQQQQQQLGENGYPHSYTNGNLASMGDQQHQQQQYFQQYNNFVSARPPPPQYPGEILQQQQQQQQPHPGPQQPQWQQQQQQPYENRLIKPDSGTGFDDALSVIESHTAVAPSPVVYEAVSNPVSNAAAPPEQQQQQQQQRQSRTLSIKSEVDSPLPDNAAPTSETILATPSPLPESSGPGRKRKSASSVSAASSSTVVSSTKATTGGGGGGKKKKTEEQVDPLLRAEKERERRFSNNTRERMRIRDINDALTELGRICMNLRPKGTQNEKPQTKLGVLNLAVDVITTLEQKVRERNLNPSALILQRGGVDVPGAPVGVGAVGLPAAAQQMALPPPSAATLSGHPMSSSGSSTGSSGVGVETPSPDGGGGGGGGHAAPPIR